MAKEKDYRLGDGDGLYLVVQANGGKLWRWSYEFNGKEKLFFYGPYPSVTLTEARDLHVEARALNRTGIDPAADKQARIQGQLESDRVYPVVAKKEKLRAIHSCFDFGLHYSFLPA